MDSRAHSSRRALFALQPMRRSINPVDYRLRQFWYEIKTGRSGAPEIKGYTQDISTHQPREASKFVNTSKAPAARGRKLPRSAAATRPVTARKFIHRGDTHTGKLAAD